MGDDGYVILGAIVAADSGRASIVLGNHDTSIAPVVDLARQLTTGG